ncbi:flagellar hook-length control protein FliK [Aeoliella sp. SH292]|uniref:flagellar hook-length control protein FliK n=1 Tax=Aeoliella sp. SH292 TaxID=3454464 RepID=UPI003F961467
MSTSSVNPMTLLATPATGNARALAVPDGFAESLSKAIRREDAPVARRERPEPAGPDQPVSKSAERSTAPADADVEQDTANTEADTSAAQTSDTPSQEQEQQDEKSAAEVSADVVAISEQAKQQANVVLQEVIAVGDAVVEPVVEAMPSSTDAAPQKPNAADGMPAQATGEVPLEVPIAQSTETAVTAIAETIQESSLVQKEASTQEAQVATESLQGTPLPPLKLHTPSDVPQDEQPQDGEVGSSKPTDGSTIPQEMVPVIPVQAAHGETERKSNDDGQQSTSKVEPVTAGETASAAAELEVDALKLHAEGEHAAPEPKDRPAVQATNFPSTLERTNSLTSRRTTPTETPSHQMPQVDAQRFVSRVSRAFQVAENRGGPLQLRLSPPELGALKIELSIQQGTLTAKLETETAAAKSVLLDNLPALRERLATQEIRIDKFEVDVRQQNSGEQPNWQAQQDGEDARHARAVATGRRPGQQQTTEAPATGATTPTRTHHNGQFSAVA